MKFRRMCSSRSALPCAGGTPPSVSRLVRSGQVASAAPRYTPASRCRPDSGSGLVGVTLAMRSARLPIVTVVMDMAPALTVTWVLARPSHSCRTWRGAPIGEVAMAVREARLRSEWADLYSGVRPEVWHVAAELVPQVLRHRLQDQSTWE